VSSSICCSREHESNKLICLYSSAFRGQLVRALQLVKGSNPVEDTWTFSGANSRHHIEAYISATFKVTDTIFFNILFEKAFKMMNNGIYFIVIALIKDFGLCKLDDLWRHKRTRKWSKIKYGVKFEIN